MILLAAYLENNPLPKKYNCFFSDSDSKQTYIPKHQPPTQPNSNLESYKLNHNWWWIVLGAYHRDRHWYCNRWYESHTWESLPPYQPFTKGLYEGYQWPPNWRYSSQRWLPWADVLSEVQHVSRIKNVINYGIDQRWMGWFTSAQTWKGTKGVSTTSLPAAICSTIYVNTVTLPDIKSTLFTKYVNICLKDKASVLNAYNDYKIKCYGSTYSFVQLLTSQITMMLHQTKFSQ